MANKFELTEEVLKKILEEKSMEFTLDEIEQLMNSEVAKPEEEMDTELVDMCASVLAKAYNPDYKEEQPTKIFRPWEMEAAETAVPEKAKKKIIPFKRVLIVTAAVALVVVAFFALPAGAALFGKSDSDGVIGFYKDFFKINVSDEETTTDSVVENDLVNQMILDSLKFKPLPTVLLSDEYEKSVGKVVQDDDKSIIIINVCNNHSDVSGYIGITQYKSAEFNMINGQMNIPEDTYRYFKEMIIDSKEIIVFGNDEKSYINYSEGATNYEIALICNFDTMVSIAETINVKG